MKSRSQNTPDFQHDTQELVANITKLMAEAEEMLAESTSHHAEEKVALLRSRGNHNEKRAIDHYIAAKDTVSHFLKRTDVTIRACPYESLAIALGVGALLGGILSRGDDRKHVKR